MTTHRTELCSTCDYNYIAKYLDTYVMIMIMYKRINSGNVCGSEFFVHAPLRMGSLPRVDPVHEISIGSCTQEYRPL